MPERPFHAGDDHQDVGGQEGLAVRQHAVEPGHPDVVDTVHAVAHQFGGQRRLFRHGHIGRARSEHDDARPARTAARSGRSHDDGARERVVLRHRVPGDDPVVDLRPDPGHEHGLTGVMESGDDRVDLFRRLAGAVDRLGHAAAQGAVQIEGRELHVGDVAGAQGVDGRVDRDLALAHVAQQSADPIALHVDLPDLRAA